MDSYYSLIGHYSLQKAYEKQFFGLTAPPGHLVLKNRIPSLIYANEIILESDLDAKFRIVWIGGVVQ